MQDAQGQDLLLSSSGTQAQLVWDHWWCSVPVSKEQCDLPWRQGMTVTSVQEHVFTFKRMSLSYAGESFANEVSTSSKFMGTARTVLHQFYPH